MNSQYYVKQSLRSNILYCLNNDLLDTAEFTAERLIGISGSKDSESAYLYALALFRQHKYKSTYRLTAKHVHVGCSYLFAKCSLILELQNEGINALMQTKHLWNDTNNDGIDQQQNFSNNSTRSSFYGTRNINEESLDNNEIVNKNADAYFSSGPDKAAVFCLLGKLHASINNIKESAAYHTRALCLNPLMWESYEQLCQLGINVSTKNIFRVHDGSLLDKDTQISKSKMSNKFVPIPPKSFFGKSTFSNDIFTIPDKKNHKNNSNNSSGSILLNKKDIDTRNESTTDHRISNSTNSNNNKTKNDFDMTNIFSTPKLKHASLPDAPIRKPIRNENNTTDITDSIKRNSQRNISSKINSRLIQSTPTNNNINDSNAKIEKRGKSYQYSNQPNTNFLNSNNALDLRKREHKLQADTQLMALYLQFANALKAMYRYDCYNAIRIFKQLPDVQIDTPYVLGKLGKLNFEIVNYEEAEQYFIRLRKLDRTRVEEMEYYSTLLWHLHKEIELSHLCHDLYEINKNCPQTWVAIGNLFSLQRETDEAIKSFQKAVQMDQKFAYAYTLQGHEYVANDAYENALDNFRNALLYDIKHYNAYYGIGMVYLKLGDFSKAEFHFRKARDINPVNVVLICCVGMVLEKLNKADLALKQYELATELQPQSPLAVFKKGQLLSSLQKIPEAIQEFERLKSIAPDEASVHFLLGQLYTIVGRKTEAIKEYTVALNLDHKGSHLIKEALESLNEE